MANDEISEEISRKLLINGGGYKLPVDQADLLCQDISASFGINSERYWPWEGLTAGEVVQYGGEVGEWVVKMEAFLSAFSDRIYLVVTSEKPGPWDVFDCDKSILIDMLKELPFFEYFIVDRSLKALLFDTHENCLRFVAH